MNIQIVSEYFYPDDFRINDIVKELVCQGHDVQVLTGLPDYATGKIPPEYHWFRKRKQLIFGAKVRRVSMTARKTGAICRAMNYATFLLTSTLYAMFCKKPKCDAIFVYETSPVFQALPAIIFKKRTKKKLTLYCCDLWPESLKAWGISETGLPFKMVKKFSSWLYRQCDTVAITSTPFRDYLVQVCGVENERIVYLPQHAEDDYASIAGQYEQKDGFDFLFAGNIGAVQNVELIIKAVFLIDTDKKYTVHIVGDGSQLQNCKQLCKTYNIQEKIVFHGRHPASEMAAFYKMADCFLLTLSGTNFIGMTLPAKAQGYLCAGKPIVASIDGAAHEMILQADCGEVVPADDEHGLAQKMKLMIEHPEQYRQKGRNGRKFYETNYTKQIFTTNLLELLEK